MKSWNLMSASDLAQRYVEHKGGPRNMAYTANALYVDVQDYLRRSGLGHRINDAAAIATEAHEIAKQIVALESSDFQDNVREGTTADDAAMQRMENLSLAGQVEQMSLDEYGAQRERLGMSQSLSSFLGGQE